MKTKAPSLSNILQPFRGALQWAKLRLGLYEEPQVARNIDLPNRKAYLHNTKNGDPRPVPFTKDAVAILEP